MDKIIDKDGRADFPPAEDERILNAQREIVPDSVFFWRELSGIRVLVCGPLDEAGFVNGFSTRLGGVSPFPENDLNLAGFDEDSTANINENRRRFLNIFGGTYSLATVWQVHGDAIKIVRTSDEAANSDTKHDAVICDLSNHLAGVKTADCVPVLIGDPRTKAYAAVHAGWRGTARSIVQKTVRQMSETFGSEPADLIAAVGPAALCENYEIGKEVIDAFRSAFEDLEKYLVPTRDGHALIDLHLANRDQLIWAGLSPNNIFTSPFCTMERTDLFFSYRIEKPLYGKTGRLMSVIGLR